MTDEEKMRLIKALSDRSRVSVARSQLIRWRVCLALPTHSGVGGYRDVRRQKAAGQGRKD